MKLVAATGNAGKLAEFTRILAPLGIEVVSPADLGVQLDVEETGTTFAENARIKAEYIYRKTGLPCVADDSGLCVDALEGRPGVYSARYQGEDTPYPEKIAALLREVENVPEEGRGAQFVAAICCFIDNDTVIDCQGVCRGRMAHKPSGTGGFGYDPIFLVGDKSFADLSAGEKDAVSHRGKALQELVKKLSEYLQSKGEHL